MTNKMRLILGGIISTLVLLACNFPLSALKLNPAALQPPAADQASATPATPDYSVARLTVADLPAGFRELTPEELAALCLSTSQFTDAFAGMLAKAKPENFAAFTNTSSSFEVLASALLVPLTPLERGAVDLFLKDPQRLLKDFSAVTNLADITIDQNAKPVGDASGSVLFAIKDAPLKMTGALTASRRGEALQVVVVFFPDGTQPTLTSYAAAQIVDNKLTLVK